MGRGWDEMRSKIPSSPTHSVILWCEPRHNENKTPSGCSAWGCSTAKSREVNITSIFPHGVLNRPIPPAEQLLHPPSHPAESPAWAVLCAWVPCCTFGFGFALLPQRSLRPIHCYHGKAAPLLHGEPGKVATALKIHNRACSALTSPCRQALYEIICSFDDNGGFIFFY